MTLFLKYSEAATSQVVKKILVLNIFLKFQENVSRKVRHHLKGS